MMQIKMLRNARGSEDGFTVKHYADGEAYEVATGLGSTFVRSGDAERTGGDEVEALPGAEPVPAAEKASPKGEAKAVNGAPENRATAPTSNKAGT